MKKELAIMAVFATAIISGFSIFINKFAISGMNSSIFTFGKNVMVAMFLAGIILMSGNFSKIKELKKKEWLSLIIVGLIGGSIPFVLFFKGLQLTNSAAGSFIHKTMFIFVAILAIYFLKEKLHKAVFAGAILLLAGNFMILKLSNFAWTTGSTMILIATLFWAVENTYSKKLLAGMDGNVLAFGRMFFGSVFIMIYLAFTGEIKLLVSLNQNQLGWIMFTTIVLLSYVVTWYNGLQHVKATIATSILLLGSPVTTLLNYVLSGTVLTIGEVAGMISIATGLVIVVMFSEKLGEGQSSAISTA